jgi:hypothetical protein
MAVIGNSSTQQAFTPAVDYFSGNGSTTAFTLSRPVASVAQVQVTIDNVAQNPSSAYTVSSNTITFTSAPLSGTNNIYVYYTSPITQVIAPGQGTVNTTALGNITNIASGNSSLTLQTGSSPTTAVTIDTSQNVGIGTTSPNKKLEVRNGVLMAGNASQVLVGRYDGSFPGTATNGYFSLDTNNNDGTNGGLTIKTLTSDSLTEKMRIDSSGNLLVGATTGTNGRIIAKQTIADNVLYLNGSNATTPYGLQIYYSAAAPNSTGSEFFYCNDTSAVRMSLRSNGGIVNYSANNVNLSDQREKKDITLAPNYLDKICQIPIKTFLFNDQTDTDLNLGAIAQDVQAVCPELVMESNWAGKDQPEKMRLSIYQTDLQYALMKSIQELKAINDQQAETINALTARIEALESKP